MGCSSVMIVSFSVGRLLGVVRSCRVVNRHRLFELSGQLVYVSKRIGFDGGALDGDDRAVF